jgi:hypothetical protein
VKSSIAHLTDHGIGITWPGWSSDWAIICAWGSKIAHEKSSSSQITDE